MKQENILDTTVHSESSDAQKPAKKWYENVIFYVLVAIGLMEIGSTIGGILAAIPVGITIFSRTAVSEEAIQNMLINGIPLDPLSETILDYLPFIGIWGACLLWFLKKNNRPLYRSFKGYCTGNTVTMLLLGFGIGAGMNGVCILVAYLHGDIHLSWDSFQFLPLLSILLCVFIQSSAEELVCRGYLYQKLLYRYHKPIVAIIGNSLLFSLLHILNPGVNILGLMDIFVSGLLFSLMVYYLDSLWCAFAAHTAWNFTQNIVFGLPNSGMIVPFSMFKLDVNTVSDSFAYNTTFGVEGTTLAIVVEVVVCVILCMWGQKHHKTPADIWADSAD